MQFLAFCVLIDSLVIVVVAAVVVECKKII